MKKLNLLTISAILIIAYCLMPLQIKAQGQKMGFMEWNTNRGSQTTYVLARVLTDGAGNVTKVGTTYNWNGTTDIIVTKTDNRGNSIFSISIDGPSGGNDAATSAVLDSDNVIVCGFETDTVAKMAVVKINSSGGVVWTRLYSCVSSVYGSAADVTVDNNHNFYVTGGIATMTTGGFFQTLKVLNGGSLQWHVSYNYGAGEDFGVKVTNDNKYVYVAGGSQAGTNNYKKTAISYDRTTGSQNSVSVSSTSSSTKADLVTSVKLYNNYVYIAGAEKNTTYYDGYCEKFDTLLVSQWSATYTTGNDNIWNAIDVDNSGNVTVAGSTKVSGAQGKNATMINYNSSGTQQWVKTDSLEGDDEYTALKYDNGQTNIDVCGYKTTSLNHEDYLVRKYTVLGGFVWEAGFDGMAHGEDKALNIAVDVNDDILVVGESSIGNSEFELRTVKYKEYDIVTPTDLHGEAPANSFLYYENRGQLVSADTNHYPVMDERFYTNNSSPALYFTNNSFSFVFAHVDTVVATQDTLHRIDVTFPGGNTENAKIYPMNEQPSYLNYFLAQCPDGITEVHGNQRLVVPDLYTNIDLMYCSNGGGFKYYFVVKPGAHATDIQEFYDGASSVVLNGSTHVLIVNSSIGCVSFQRPKAYNLSSSNVVIPLTDSIFDWDSVGVNTYGFDVGTYDNTKVLVIEVEFADQGGGARHTGSNHQWESYFGGTGDDVGTGVSTDTDGNAYFTGYTSSTTYFPPITGAFTYGGLYDGYIARINKVNSSVTGGGDLKWVSYIGGSNNDFAYGVTNTLDGLVGRCYVTGITRSNDISFPQVNIGTYRQTALHGTSDAFILAIDNNYGGVTGQGSVWLTYFGGNGDESGNCITKDASDNVYIGGQTSTTAYDATSCGVPTSGGFPKCNPNTHFNNGGYYGNSSGGGGGAFDGFVAKFTANGVLQYSSFFGGTGDDEVRALATDVNGNVFFGGITSGGSNFPFPATLPTGAYNQTTYGGGSTGEYDGFMAKLDNVQVLQWSTFWGGSGDDAVNGIDVDITTSANVFITGSTTSQTPACSATCRCTVPATGEFPLCNPANGYAMFQDVHGNAISGDPGADAFVAEFSNTGAIEWSTYYGGGEDDEGKGLVCDEVSITVNNLGVYTSSWQPNVLITGNSNSYDMPAFQPLTIWTGFGAISSGVLYLDLTWNNGTMQVMDIDLGATHISYDPFIAMFINDGRPMWATNYGDVYQVANDKNNAVASTKSIHTASEKNMFFTGYTEHTGHEIVTNQYIINPPEYWQNPVLNSVSDQNRDATFSRFGYLSNSPGSGISEQLTAKGDLLIYPNPTSRNVFMNGTIEGSYLKIRILDITGRVVYSEDSEKNTTIKKSINIENWNNGMYIVQIITDKGSMSRKFIKQ